MSIGIGVAQLEDAVVIPEAHRFSDFAEGKGGVFTRPGCLASQESEQVGVDGIGVRGGHSMGEARVGFQRAVLQESG